MFHVSGDGDHWTRSVDREIFMKSVISSRRTMAKADMTKSPVTRKTPTTKADFRIVLMILFRIQVLIRW